MPGKILTALAQFEAETHRSKGRIKEALDVYDTLLNSSPYMTLNTKVSIEERIDLLRSELENTTHEDEDRDIEEAIQKFRKAVVKDASTTDLRKGAKVFYKKGLYADALENLKLLIQQNAADEFCVKAVIACMIQLHAKGKFALAVDLFIAETFEDREKADLFKMTLADKMVEMGYTKYAAMLK